MNRIEDSAFYGMSEEAFTSGSGIVDAYKDIDPQDKADTVAPVIRGISYETPLASMTLDQLEETAQAAEELANRARDYQARLIQKQETPEHIDLDY